MICRYPVLRLLGAACALVLYIAAGVFYGYSGRLVPLGAILASAFPGRKFLPDHGAPAHSLHHAGTHSRLLHLAILSILIQWHCCSGEARGLRVSGRHAWRSAAGRTVHTTTGKGAVDVSRHVVYADNA